MPNLIAKLFSSFSNPTVKWPPQSKLELVYDMSSRSINGLRLDGALEDAQAFGPCEYWIRTDEDIDLFYQKHGLSLEFSSNRLISLTLVVSQGSFLAKSKRIENCSPVIVDFNGRAHVLTDTSTLRDLVLCFGQPFESAPVGEDMVHTFIINKNFVDTYHDQETGRLLQLEISEAKDV